MYNKLFSKIVLSSIWLEPLPTRVVWIAFLATMDEDGFVQCSAMGNVASLANVTIEQARAAIKTLESPDAESGNPDNEGRRIERIPGGWMVLNSQAHREMVTREMAKERTRLRVKKHREEKRSIADVTLGNAQSQSGNGSVTQSEAEAEADTDTEAEANTKAKRKEYSSLFETFWSTFPRGRKTKKGNAATAWKKAIAKANPQTIIDAAAEYAASHVGQGDFVQGPEPWLNGECWDDDREAWKEKQSNGKHPKTYVQIGAEQTASQRERFLGTQQRLEAK